MRASPDCQDCRVWLVKYSLEGIPRGPGDLPLQAVACFPAHGRRVAAAAAKQLRWGFNLRELQEPLGYWAVAFGTGREPISGQQLTFHREPSDDRAATSSIMGRESR